MNQNQRIDSHQHFWKYNPAQQAWINETMAVLKRDFLPHDLKPLLEHNQIDGCIAVQASQTEDENAFLLELAEQHDFIKGVVGWIDLQANSVAERLSYYKQFDKIKGFRHVIQDEDLDFMVRPAFLKGVGLLRAHDYTYDILIYPQHLPNTLKLVQQFPHQRFVIDHIAKPNIRSKEIEHWKKGLQEVATSQNVYCKISGMVTEAKWNKWGKEDFIPYMDSILNVFGVDRVMFGSDWPVCMLSATYESMMNIVTDYFSFLTRTEQQQFFGGNAARFYGLLNV